MTERDFWQIIDKLDPAGEDLRKIAFPSIEALSQCSEDEIREFQNILSEKLFRIDGEAWAKRIGDRAFDGNKSTFDGLHFLHARCCVIANGRAFYDDVRRNPSHMPGNQTFATLLTIAPRAYETKTGAPLEHHTLFSRETFSNRWAWDKSQLAIIAFPPLVLLPLMPPVVTGFAIATLLISVFDSTSAAASEDVSVIKWIAVGFGIMTALLLRATWTRKGRFILRFQTWRWMILGSLAIGLVLPLILLL